VYEEAAMATMVSKRRSTFGVNCVQCDDGLIAPEKSEYRDGMQIRHQWSCTKCAMRFETLETIPIEAAAMDHEFPLVLVA
jgi:hypothetical protein